MKMNETKGLFGKNAKIPAHIREAYIGSLGRNFEKIGKEFEKTGAHYTAPPDVDKEPLDFLMVASAFALVSFDACEQYYVQVVRHDPDVIIPQRMLYEMFMWAEIMNIDDGNFLRALRSAAPDFINFLSDIDELIDRNS